MKTLTRICSVLLCLALLCGCSENTMTTVPSEDMIGSVASSSGANDPTVSSEDADDPTEPSGEAGNPTEPSEEASKPVDPPDDTTGPSCIHTQEAAFQLQLEAAFVFDLGTSQELLTFSLTAEESAVVRDVLFNSPHSTGVSMSTEGIHFCTGDEDWLYLSEQSAAQNLDTGCFVSLSGKDNLKMKGICQEYLAQCQKTPVSEKVNTTNLEKVVEGAPFAIGNQPESTSIIPHGTITSGMVLQRRCVNHLTGFTTESQIAVEFNGKVYAGTVTNDEFSVYLPPAEAGGPYSLTFYSENGKKTLKNVYVGEVFLISGQSNVIYHVNMDETKTGMTYPVLGNRIVQIYKVPASPSSIPNTNVSSTWKSANTGDWQYFSAVGYIFGLELYDLLQVPIGMVQAANGGTPLTHWLSQEDYDALRSQQVVYTKTDKLPCEGYNGQIAPLLNMQFRGVVWYQGEANTSMPESYEGELKFYIDAYRRLFQNPDLTFTIIELPKYGKMSYAWGEIRSVQQRVAADVSNVCLSVSIDQGDMEDVHPADKTVVGRRAAQATAEAFFGVDCSNPPIVVSAQKISATQVVLTLKNAQGLVAKNGVNGFQFSTGESQFRTISDISINGNTVTITAPDEIRILRYGWVIFFSDEETCKDPSKQVTIFNGAGLPMDQGYWDFGS